VIATAVFDLLLPTICVACDAPTPSRALVCDACWGRVPPLPAPQCERCGHPTRGASCEFCAALPDFVRAARSVCWVPAPVPSAALRALKYDGWAAVATEMAVRMARLSWPADVVAERTAVVPVPLARGRIRERGYNQAALLARHIAGYWRIPCWEDAVVRARETGTQTRLTPSERSTNVHHAFRAADDVRLRLPGAHLVLVDDVLTTGATLNAAASSLFDAGARIISYLTFGRARSATD
jgi:ComF family protein